MKGEIKSDLSILPVTMPLSLLSKQKTPWIEAPTSRRRRGSGEMKALRRSPNVRGLRELSVRVSVTYQHRLWRKVSTWRLRDATNWVALADWGSKVRVRSWKLQVLSKEVNMLHHLLMIVWRHFKSQFSSVQIQVSRMFSGRTNTALNIQVKSSGTRPLWTNCRGDVNTTCSLFYRI